MKIILIQKFDGLTQNTILSLMKRKILICIGICVINLVLFLVLPKVILGYWNLIVFYIFLFLFIASFIATVVQFINYRQFNKSTHTEGTRRKMIKSPTLVAIWIFIIIDIAMILLLILTFTQTICEEMVCLPFGFIFSLSLIVSTIIALILLERYVRNKKEQQKLHKLNTIENT